MIDNSDDAHIQSPHGCEFEGLTHEGRRLELWVDDPEIGEPAFRWFESDADDLINAYGSHVSRDGTDAVTEVFETLPGSEWVMSVSTYGSWYRVWAKLRDE